jgi:cardiolipin synthase C
MTKRNTAGRLVTILKWMMALVLAVPVLFYLTFTGLLEITERQWLGRAPQHEATNVRLQKPHTWALLDVGADSLATRLRLIAAAKKSIDLEFFIYELDTASRLISNALIRRAQEGVRVRVIVDFARPVFKLQPLFAKKLEDAGIEVRYYNTAGMARFFAVQHRTHRKILVVDGASAVVGGRNIADDYFDFSSHYNFLDSDVLISGQIVQTITASFALYWNSQWIARTGAITGSNAENNLPDANLWLQGSSGDDALAATLTGGTAMHHSHQCDDVQFVTDHPGPGVERRLVFQEISRLAQEAQKTVRLESPYVVLRKDGLKVVHDLVDRGVTLQILTNGLHSTDAYYAVAALLPTLGSLQRERLQLFAYDGRELTSQNGWRALSANHDTSSRWGIHAKRAVFDDQIVAVGTYNIDSRSANLNSELMLVCRGNSELAAEAAASFDSRLQQASPILGTDRDEGRAGLLKGAGRGKVFITYAVSPLARLLDFLL